METLKNKHPNIWEKVKGHFNSAIRAISAGEWNDLVKYVDYQYFNSITELRAKPNSELGDKITTTSRDNDGLGGGGDFECISLDASSDNITDNGGTIIVTTLNAAYKMIGADYEVNIDVFGAKKGVQFSNVKNMSVPVNPIGVIPDCTAPVNAAIAWLDRNRDK